MIFAGSHLSSGKGYEAMGRHALKLGEDTFAFFTRNPRGGRAKDIDPKDAAALRKLTAEHSFGTLVAHAPYTMNLCSAKEDVRKFGLEMIRDDLVRMEMTPHSYYNFHPGSHTGQGAETGIRQIAEALNLVLRPDQTTTVLLETMAGAAFRSSGRSSIRWSCRRSWASAWTPATSGMPVMILQGTRTACWKNSTG